jgi:hypothetical protein
MTKGWQESQKPGSDSLSGKLNSASNKEVDHSAAYGPSIEEKARALKPTGERRSANWSGISAEPRDELATPAKDGKSSVNEDLNNNLAINNKGTSQGNVPNSIRILGVPGIEFFIEIPANLKIDDPRIDFEIKVKTLVEHFKFEENNARKLIIHLSSRGQYTGMTVMGRLYSIEGPNRGRVRVYIDPQMVTYYQREAANQPQKESEAQKKQRLELEKKQRLNRRNEYVSNSPKYSDEIIKKLEQLINKLRKDYRETFDQKVEEIYRKIATNSEDRELLQVIRIQVLYERFKTNVENILSGKPPAQNQSRPATAPPQNKNTPQPTTSQQRQPATSQPRQLGIESNKDRTTTTSQQRQPATSQPRQLTVESNKDRTRWQTTGRSFQEQFAANYSREQIIVIQRLVGATPDGNYGEETAQKVYQWQQNNRVPNPDGLVGDITHRAMVAQLRTTNTAAVDILSPQQKAPPSPVAAPTNPVRNPTDSRTQLEAFSPAVKTLLGRQETFQPDNYPQLLRVGNKLQELPPAEFEYIYQPLASSLAGNLTQLERSIDIFTNTRRLVIAEYQAPGGSYSQQKINDSLFGEKPITSNPSWQQVLKDLISSVLESPKYAVDILGEVFDFFKEHWISFLAVTTALIGAQALVTALTGIPEPTFLSKVLAVSLQGFILTVFGVGIVVSLESAIDELMNWWNAASTANGNPEQIASASRSFLRMVGNLTLLIISSKQFQAQLKPEKLARLQAMLNRRQQLSRLPDAYQGTTIDLVPDPDNPNSYVYKLRPNPNAQKLPPSSRPSIDPTNSQPPAPRPTDGGGLRTPIQPPVSIPPTSPITPGQLTPPTSTGQTANPEPILPQQVQQPQVSDTSLPPTTEGQLTPPTSSSPVTNPNQTTFADPPQPQNLGILPPQTPDGQLVVPSSKSTAGVEQPSTQQHQPTESSQPSTPQSESIPLQEVPEAIRTLLSTTLGRELSQVQARAAIEGNLERQDIETLVRTAESWNRVKLNYLSYPDLMEAIIRYRGTVVFEIVTEVFNRNQEFDQSIWLANTIVESGGQILGNMTEIVAAGSTDLTSDYDVTFSAGAGNEGLEILAVERFNEVFRRLWGLESGIVFDTNVYTSGHMRSAAFKGDGAKLNLVNKLAKDIEDILETGNRPDENQKAQINDLVAKLNGLGNEGTSINLGQLETGNFDTFRRQITGLQVRLTRTVKEQYQNSKNDYGAGPEFDELATVMSLVHMREFWNQGQPPGADWDYVENRMLGEQVPENVRNLNRTRLDRAGEIHTQLVNERRSKIELLRQENPNLANNPANLEMRANNLLAVEYLHQVRDKLTQIRAAEQSRQGSEQVEELKLELQELQSKVLFFANEAYMVASSAEQVVLNQQIKLGVELPTAQYAASINEQTAFVGEQLAHMQGNLGKALWKTAKYVDRILTAINEIHKQTNKQVPSPEVMTRVAELKPLVKQLIDIKKNSQLTDTQKNQAAANLAEANRSVLGADTAELGRIILDLQIDVYLEMQNYLNLPNQNQ